MPVASNMRKAYIGLGSNLGDRAGNLLLGLRGIVDAGLEVSRLSQIYETEAVETFAQTAFLNMSRSCGATRYLRPKN